MVSDTRSVVNLSLAPVPFKCVFSLYRALERKKGLRLFVVRIGVVDDSSEGIVEKNETKNFQRPMFDPAYLNINKKY